mmetsp:Transcript_677/g.1621  ORF Transcript_677/g.1621 Transcript_677/m.1621 type:complete len:169 (-) Transcript_677:75-581(-)
MGRPRPTPKRRGAGRGSAAGSRAAAAVAEAVAAAESPAEPGEAASAEASPAPIPPAASRGPGVRRDRRVLQPVDKEIRRLQADHRFLSMTKSAFARLVRDTQGHFTEEPLRWAQEALLLFQEVCEEYLMNLFSDAYLCTHHRRRVTLSSEDVRLVRRLRQPHCWGESM